LSEEEKQILKTHRDTAFNITIVGQVVGRSPAYKDILNWSKEFLHWSLQSITMLGQGYFEARFKESIGALHTLNDSFRFGQNEMVFAKWSPNFCAKIETTIETFQFPV
jgi:hypothetical protein